MTPGLQALLAFTPIALSGVLLVGLGWSAKRAMPLVYVVTAVIALMAWGVSFNRVAAATLEGIIITVQVLWIIFGALLLLNTLKHSGGIASIRSGFARITNNGVHRIITQCRLLRIGDRPLERSSVGILPRSRLLLRSAGEGGPTGVVVCGLAFVCRGGFLARVFRHSVGTSEVAGFRRLNSGNIHRISSGFALLTAA